MLISFLGFIASGELFSLVEKPFWLALIFGLISFVYFRRKFSFKTFYWPAALALFFSMNLWLGKLADFSVWANQIHIFILSFFCAYAGNSDFLGKKGVMVNFLVLDAALAAFLFFKSDFSDGFFWKEISLFLASFVFLEAHRKISGVCPIEEENSGKSKCSPAFSWAGAAVLAQLGWLGAFLPIRPISLAAFWIIGFVLIKEAFSSYFSGEFSSRIFSEKAVLAAFLGLAVLAGAVWIMP